MPNQRVLIDTSIWVEYFRDRNHKLVAAVKDLIMNQHALLCGVVLSELLAGVKVKKDREALKQTLDALEYTEASRSTWISAGEMSSRLRRQGIGVPLTDLLLAALALENGSDIFTLGNHFDRIPEVKRFYPAKP